MSRNYLLTVNITNAHCSFYNGHVDVRLSADEWRNFLPRWIVPRSVVKGQWTGLPVSRAHTQTHTCNTHNRCWTETGCYIDKLLAEWTLTSWKPIWLADWPWRKVIQLADSALIYWHSVFGSPPCVRCENTQHQAYVRLDLLILLTQNKMFPRHLLFDVL